MNVGFNIYVSVLRFVNGHTLVALTDRVKGTKKNSASMLASFRDKSSTKCSFQSQR